MVFRFKVDTLFVNRDIQEIQMRKRQPHSNSSLSFIHWLSERAFERRVYLQFLVLIFVFLSGAFLVGGRGLPPVDAKETVSEDIFEELKVFTDVLALVQRDYVDEVGAKKLVEGAIKGMLTSLDPHSGYLDPDYYKDLQVQTRGEFGGLGIEIAVRDGLLVVVTPMEGSPAAKAGILPGDAIVKIEGQFTKDFALVDAVKKLRGLKGTPVEISVHRKGVPDLIDVRIVRDDIMVRSVKSRYLGEGFGYVRLSQFMETTYDDLLKSVKKMTSQAPEEELQGLILDVRNNPGGLLTQAVRVSDLFLKDGVIVYTKGRVHNQQQKFFAHPRGTLPDFPVIVLVNGGSASASEIVAGALQDHGRGLVLGSQTFGKGSVQTITPLGNGGAVTLTTALYFTKSGRSLQAKGVTPDIEYEPEVEVPAVVMPKKKKNRSLYRESDLPGAIPNPDGAKSPLHKINKTPTVLPSVKVLDVERDDLTEILKNDAQLERAFELLKTFDVFTSEGKKAA